MNSILKLQEEMLNGFFYFALLVCYLFLHRLQAANSVIYKNNPTLS